MKLELLLQLHPLFSDMIQVIAKVKAALRMFPPVHTAGVNPTIQAVVMMMDHPHSILVTRAHQRIATAVMTVSHHYLNGEIGAIAVILVTMMIAQQTVSLRWPRRTIALMKIFHH